MIAATKYQLTTLTQDLARTGVSGAKSDPADAHVLADMIRTDHTRLRPVAGDSELAEAVKVLTRAPKTLIWERSRHTLRLRQALLDFYDPGSNYIRIC